MLSCFVYSRGSWVNIKVRLLLIQTVLQRAGFDARFMEARNCLLFVRRFIQVSKRPNTFIAKSDIKVNRVIHFFEILV